MKKLLFLVIALTIVTATSAQVQQARWWYFGSGAGLDFNTSPTADPNGTLQTYEGCSSISSPIGTLYFYTDGNVVKNVNHANMTNGTGLMGGGSSTQSGQVIPYPGSSTKFYVFTQAQNVGANGMRYSVVDMTLSSGLGAVTGTKNVFLNNGFAEKITGIKKNGGYWVCALKLPGDTLYAYEVTSSGVNATPVKSNTGITLGTNNFYGGMKSNPSGTQLAAAHQGITNAVHLFDFNKTNGMVTATKTISITNSNPYGVEFSPNGNLLYVQSWNASDIKQYDVNAGTAAQISSSQVTLGGGATGGGLLQLGPDGLLYGARFGQNYICRVPNPDVQGTGAGYTANAVQLSTGDVSRWGLPLFLGSFFSASIEVTDNCFGDTTYFTADTTNVDSMYWDFGDTLSGASNIGEGVLNIGHLYTDTGLYTVTLMVFNGAFSDTITDEVFIYPRQTADLGPDDTALCVGLEFTLDVYQPYAEYLWHDGSTDSAYTVAYPDSLVAVTVNGVCDTISDTIIVNFFYPFDLDIQDDTSICTYDDIILSTGLDPNAGYIHTWSNGSASNSIIAYDTGTYMVTVTEGMCTYLDTVTIGYYPEVTIDLGNDSSYCYEPYINLGPKTETNALTYEWSTGAVTANIDVSVTDLYFVTVKGTGDFCQAIDSVKWKFWHEPLVDIGNDTSFCHDDILNIEPYAYSAFPLTYLWNDNSNNSNLNVNLVGLYWVEVSDANCSMKDTIIIDQYPKLEVDLGEDIQTCNGKNITLTPMTTLPVNNYTWSDGSINSNLKISGHGTYTVSVNNDLCSASDEINVFYFEYPEIDLGADTAICPGTSYMVDVTASFEIMEYEWSTNNTSPIQEILPIDSVWYWVKSTNVVCSLTDSIFITLRDIPNTDLGPDTAICAGDNINISVRDDARNESFLWSTGDSTQVLNVSDSGQYIIMMFDGYCTTRGNIKVGLKNNPTNATVKLDAPETICLGDKVPFNVFDPRFNAYEWQDGSTGSRFIAESEGLYWIKATHDCGVVSDTVFIDKCECPIWLPTAFNPNGDDKNDKFLPSSDCAFYDYEFRVFNRWGEELFYSEDPTESWNGMYRGEDVNAGAYTWILVYGTEHEGKKGEDRMSGNVLLLR